MQQNPGTRKVLVPERLWCQQSSGASKVLVPEKLWCQHCSVEVVVAVVFVVVTEPTVDAVEVIVE
jgi:hypothetical protein